jgi:hypothetical protein
MDKIELYNRDGIHTYLKEIGKCGEGKYLLVTPIPTVQITYDNDNTTILAVDPSGGPCLGVGSKINERLRVMKIEFSKLCSGFVLTLKED